MQVSPYDRFIPQRRFTNSEAANHNISHFEAESVSDITFDQKCSDSEVKPTFINTARYANSIINYRKLLKTAMNVTDSKVLHTSRSVGERKRKEVYKKRSSWPVVARKRPLIKSPDIVLDMPDIDTTVYHHVIDWGKKGQIATIFHGEVHLWASSESKLACTQTDKSVLECVRWNRSGTKFAVSRTRSRLSIIDAKTFKIERTVICKCLDCTFTAVEWTHKDGFVAGCSNGSLIHGSLNMSNVMFFYRLLKTEIIDLKFSCNDKYLLISTLRGSTSIFSWPICLNSIAPSMIFTARSGRPCYIQSTSWHPWKESVLAMGEFDSGITIYNVNNQTVVDYNVTQPYFKDSCFLDCLTFNPLSAELLVSFFYEGDSDTDSDEGYNFLSVFSDLRTRVDEIQFHLGRVPHALWDGTGTKLATVGADENLIVWNFFGADTDREKKISRQKKKKRTDIFEMSERFHSCIR